MNGNSFVLVQTVIYFTVRIIAFARICGCHWIVFTLQFFDSWWLVKTRLLSINFHTKHCANLCKIHDLFCHRAHNSASASMMMKCCITTDMQNYLIAYTQTHTNRMLNWHLQKFSTSIQCVELTIRSNYHTNDGPTLARLNPTDFTQCHRVCRLIIK